MDVQQQIRAALAGREAQREFVENLAGDWNTLTASVRVLVSSIVDLTRAAAAAPAADSAHVAVFDGIRSSFGADGDWQKRAAELSEELGDGAGRIGVLNERVHRETVNIGVIGVTGAGKSTLLRKLSGLGEEHIPSNRFASSTATPSRIFHEPGPGQDRAVLYLHTWPTFRDEVLQPMHERAGLSAPAPATIEEFRRFPYPETIPDYAAGSERFTRRLRIARDSLASYEPLLRGGSEQITLDRLRPFVAYPPDDGSRERPYHAVRSVEIYCRFPEVGAVRLGLVDLPGSGEAGLDVHKRFLADLRNSTDLLFIVRRPSKSPSTDQDWDAAQLADDAAAGVRRGDFAHLVINRDRDLPEEYFEQALARARGDSGDLGIGIRVCDIQREEPPQVTEAILEPILDLLAKRLAYMDRDAVAFVLGGLSGVAGKVRALCRDLDRQFDGWRATLPDEDKRIRARIRTLKYQVGRQLDGVRDAYDRLYESQEPIAELSKQIEEAGREVRQWLATGLGEGSRQEWIEAFQDAIAAKGMGDELDRQYNGARERVVGVFAEIDASFDLAIDRLYGEVAAALRRKLTDKIVPAAPDNAAVLSEFAAITRSDGARSLTGATERLLTLRADYGSIFLRVGRPVIRKIEWYTDRQQPAAASRAANLTDRVAGAVGRAAGTAVGGDVGGNVGQTVGEAVSSTLHQGSRPANADPGSGWLGDYVRGPSAPQASAATQPSAGPAQPAPAAPPRGPALPAEQYPDAASQYDRLTATIEDVTSELERKFRQEALSALQVLAAAVDLYKDGAITSPDIEVEFEKVCRRAQREIWPQEFGEASAKVTADMESLRKQIQDTAAAADQVGSLANQATRL